MTGGLDLTADVRDLIARRDINAALQRYMRGLDRLDLVLQRSAFHGNAFIDCGLMAGSADEFVAFCGSFLAMMDATHHFLGQVQIDIHPGCQTASGECYFQAWHGSRDEAGSARDLFISGRYIDEYACENDEWRISKRKLITDWVKDDAADHGFYAANPKTNRGGRGGTDFSQTRDWPK